MRAHHYSPNPKGRRASCGSWPSANCISSNVLRTDCQRCRDTNEFGHALAEQIKVNQALARRLCAVGYEARGNARGVVLTPDHAQDLIEFLEAGSGGPNGDGT